MLQRLAEEGEINGAFHTEFYPFICNKNHKYVFFSLFHYSHGIEEFIENLGNIEVIVSSPEEAKNYYGIFSPEYPSADVCAIELLEKPTSPAYDKPEKKLILSSQNISIQTLYLVLSEFTSANIWYPKIKYPLTFYSKLIYLNQEEIDTLIYLSPLKSSNREIKDCDKHLISIKEKLQDKITKILNSSSKSRVFVRLFTLSPKNSSSDIYSLTASTPEEVLQIILYSQRAITSLEECLTNGIMLREFIDDIQVNFEFRLFISGYTLRAISQYKCYTYVEEFESEEIRNKIYSAICAWWKSIFKKIPYDECTIDIVFYNPNCAMDLLWKSENIKIVEINSFGAGSLCGSSLYSWINDFDILYHSKKPNIRFVEKNINIY